MRFFCFISLFLVLTFSPCVHSAAAESAPANPHPAKAEGTENQETLRTYLQLQEQIHATELAVERTREESAAATARNAAALDQRLKAIEGALSVQRASELQTMQSSTVVILIVAGALAFAAVIGLLLMTVFQWRTVHRLTTLSAPLPPVRLLGPGSATNPFGTAEMEPTESQLIAVLERLDKRVNRLEKASRSVIAETLGASPAAAPAPGPNGDGETSEPPSPAPVAPVEVEPTPEEQSLQMLGNGQAFLDQGDPAAAVAHFEQVLALEPHHAEALVRKGTALERLGRIDEAIRCYDQAIAADNSLTMAYLQKAGLFHRMERFGEALECYDMAVRTQRGKGQPNADVAERPGANQHLGL